MIEPLSQAQRDNLRRLAEKATPRPWKLHGLTIWRHDFLIIGGSWGSIDRFPIDGANAAYIAAACNAVPAFLDALEQAERRADARARADALLAYQLKYRDCELGNGYALQVNACSCGYCRGMDFLGGETGYSRALANYYRLVWEEC